MEKSQIKSNRPNYISYLLQILQRKGHYADASLACNGKVYKVHRMILSSCSEFFSAIFRQTKCDTPYIILAEVESNHIEYLLDYMYKGEVNVSEYEIEPLLVTAQYLKIKGLSNAIRNKEYKSNSFGKNNSLKDELFSPQRKKKKLCDVLHILDERNHESALKSQPYAQKISDILPPPNYNPTPSLPAPVYYDRNCNNQGTVLPSSEKTGYQYPVPVQGCTTSMEPGGGMSNYGLPVTPKIPVNQSYMLPVPVLPPKDTYQVPEGFLPHVRANEEATPAATPGNYVQSSVVKLEKNGEEEASHCGNFCNEGFGSDGSEAYSSDDDPIMVSKIRKIVKKTYRNLLTKMRRQKSSSSVLSSSVSFRNSINISTINKVEGRRMGARANYCYFCNSPQTQIWRHIKTVHKSDPQVNRLCDMKEDSEHKYDIEFLRNLGNFEHNKEVLRAGNGDLKVYRRPDNHTQLSYKSYSPCPRCLLFLSRNDLWRHCRYKCMTQSLAPNGKGMAGGFRHLMFMSSAVLGLQTNFKKNERILSQLGQDEVSIIASKDEIILHLGGHLGESLREDRNHIACQSMRLASRLLLHVRRRTNEPHATLFHILRPIYFNYVIEAVDVLSKTLMTEEPHSTLAGQEPPRIALQLGVLLRKCLAVKMGIALRGHSEEDKMDVHQFDSGLSKFEVDLQPFISDDKNLNDFLEVEIEGDGEEDLLPEDVTWDGTPVLEGESHEADSRSADDAIPQNARSAAALKRIPYSAAENAAIVKYFAHQITNSQMIRKEDIEKLFQSPSYQGELNTRSWKNIKYKVHNLIQKKNKHQ